MKPAFSLALTLLAAPLLTAAPLPDALLQEAEQAVRHLWHARDLLGGDEAALKARYQAAAARHAILAEPPARAEALAL